MIVEELYEALKEAGASEEKAKAAARALANYENRFAAIDRDLTLLKRMVGFNLAGTITILFRVFT